jgi:hypothetical protein
MLMGQGSGFNELFLTHVLTHCFKPGKVPGCVCTEEPVSLLVVAAKQELTVRLSHGVGKTCTLLFWCRASLHSLLLHWR